jgi:hypothetical protein
MRKTSGTSPQMAWMDGSPAVLERILPALQEALP